MCFAPKLWSLHFTPDLYMLCAYDVEKDIDVNQVRALAQLSCILTLLMYSLSFVANNTAQEQLNERDRVAAIAKFYAAKSAESFTGSETTRGRKTSRSRSTSPSKRSTRSSPGRAKSTTISV